jgi:DNA-binding response OmpR family regulator
VDGLDLCLAIKVDPAMVGIRVIILSALGKSADSDKGLRSGADAYLVKPFSPMELLALVNEPSVRG